MGVLQLHRPEFDVSEARSAGRAQGTPQSQGVPVSQHHLCSACSPSATDEADTPGMNMSQLRVCQHEGCLPD